MTSKERLLEFFARAPEVHCKGLCTRSCGLVPTSEAEDALIAESGSPPLSFEEDEHGPRCTLLSADGKCSVYAARPLLCRLWGAVKKMRCPFGCRPSAWLSDAQAQAMFAELHGWPDPRERVPTLEGLGGLGGINGHAARS